MLVFDVVYNNAAIQYFGPMPDFSIDDWRATITGELDIPFVVSNSHGRTWSGAVAASS